jgi:hypothetical protein
MCSILEVKSAVSQSPLALSGIVGDAHCISVYTEITSRKSVRRRACL